MSKKHKTESNGLYFFSFSNVAWIDVFTRREYQEIVVKCIAYFALVGVND